MKIRSLISIVIVLTFATFLAVKETHAHMGWLASDEDGHAIFWFGESPDDRTYHLPESVKRIHLMDTEQRDQLKTTAVDEKNFVGLRSTTNVSASEEIVGSVVYGLYHGMKLTYHVEHLPQKDAALWPSTPRAGVALQTVITRSATGGVTVSVVRNGKPASEVEVKLYCEEGHEEGKAMTDAAGLATFTIDQLEPGLNAVMVAIRNKSDVGSLDGTPHKSSADYLTSTFFFSGSNDAIEPKSKTSLRPTIDPQNRVPIVASNLPDLPEELTSFGAAIAGAKLYVYGGHTGSAHSYSTQEQSNRLWCLDLQEKDSSWETISTDDRLQGLAMVPWKDSVIRIGGFTAVNAAGEDHDLRSQNRVAVFDPALKSWTDLAPLPEPRSSLDAAVLGNMVYVFGGWKLSGESDRSEWHETAYSLDLADANSEWVKLPDPPFKRRALSVAAFDGKLFVIGGMQATGGPTTRVDIFDPESNRWIIGPSIPGSGMSGFGSSAYAINGELLVSTMDGFVHKLTPGAEAWVSIAKVSPSRFFHRMVPHGRGVLMIGGANMEIGKFTEIALVKLTRRP